MRLKYQIPYRFYTTVRRSDKKKELESIIYGYSIGIVIIGK